MPNPSDVPDGYSPLLSQMNASTDPYGSYQSDFLGVALSGRRELQMYGRTIKSAVNPARSIQSDMGPGVM
jgi:hypothetical protein